MESRSPLLFLLLLFLGGGTVLLLQNSQALGLVLFNRTIPWQLPLSIWFIAAVLLGLLLSLLLQLFLKGTNPSSNSRGDRPNPRLERLKQRPPRQPDRRTGRSDWERSRANYDWTDKELETQDEETWDIESPPKQPTRPQPPPTGEEEPQIRPQPKPQRPRPSPGPEAAMPKPPTPKSPAKSAKTQDDTGTVYDADYRILTPPYTSEEEASPRVDLDEDEEWI
ncbi:MULTISPECIES: hypothetical protein [Cyanophyceae]|uniref:hypothetical protein n=1 Tax=Cyanophyceae TaxID=3028117 RepID=UPI00016DC937|nr:MULTISPECIES: hypothetical protein [Cyanophyceae]ACA99531.1 conserved hypothetical protein [Picosynechococcus sp. PCC 7002]ANV90539.1 hypothetical protein AWQ24_07810 [Picosynechococcus sp. PCC 8807]SMQ83818.1 hypothetical protein SAMN06272774_2532 [Synechococcus sp. 7002]